jgi:hypothetical protein
MKPFKRGDLNAGSGKDMRRINIGCGMLATVNLGLQLELPGRSCAAGSVPISKKS